MKVSRVVIGVFFGAVVQVTPAIASPTMIRLGYADCAACHVSPQGGGLLTSYGRGVDVAQSARAREVPPSDADTRRYLYRRPLGWRRTAGDGDGVARQHDVVDIPGAAAQLAAPQRQESPDLHARGLRRDAADLDNADRRIRAT